MVRHHYVENLTTLAKMKVVMDQALFDSMKDLKADTNQHKNQIRIDPLDLIDVGGSCEFGSAQYEAAQDCRHLIHVVNSLLEMVQEQYLKLAFEDHSGHDSGYVKDCEQCFDLESAEDERREHQYNRMMRGVI